MIPALKIKFRQGFSFWINVFYTKVIIFTLIFCNEVSLNEIIVSEILLLMNINIINNVVRLIEASDVWLTWLTRSNPFYVLSIRPYTDATVSYTISDELIELYQVNL